LITSENDHKKYLPYRLSNGLKVLLIENNESDRCAAALAVNAGHFDDPTERQGLAHFLEHMLFLGTEKYPDGSEYQQFISQHGGTNNAWTATEHTCFFFDIHHQYFEQALDRFSDFFISPLLSEEFVNKERKNIDSEFKLKLKDDIRRLYDVHKETVNPLHPFSQFSVGNHDTLADNQESNIRDEVVAFFEEHYQAERMTLAIEGPMPLDELKSLTIEKFSAIKNNSQPKQAIKHPLYLKEHQGIKISVRPEKKSHNLILSFAMPSIDEFYRQKPISYISYLIGHEGPGSLLSLLKTKQWAMGLTAGGGINGSNFKDFNISIHLSEKGILFQQEIIEAVFSYLNLLKREGFKELYYQEKQAINKLSFDFHEKVPPLESVKQLVLNMQHYPEQDYILGDYIMEGANAALIKNFLDFFTPENMRLLVIAPTVNTDHTSRWYKVPYSVEKFSQQQLMQWHNAPLNECFFLPLANPYIVHQPKLIEMDVEQQIPQILVEDRGLKVWHKQDNSFFVPKGIMYINVDSPFSVASVDNIAMTKLLVEIFCDSVIEENYHAEIAGIHYHLYSHQGGFTLQLSGLSEKQPVLLQSLGDGLKRHQFDHQRFELFKKQLLLSWRNAEKSKSISQLFAWLGSLMQPNNPESHQLIQALEKVTFEQFNDFCDQVFAKIAIEAFIYGNWNQSQAKAIAEIIKQTFIKQRDDNAHVNCPVTDIAKLGTVNVELCLPEHDYATVIYYPLALTDVKTTVLAMVTSQLMSPHFFQTMRTEKQFGYLVGVGYIPINQFPGIALYIQSPKNKAGELTTAIDHFIDLFDEQLKSMSADDWQHLKHGIIGQLEEKDSSLRIKGQRYWSSITSKDYSFNLKEKLIAAIDELTLAETECFIAEQMITRQLPDRVILSSIKSSDEQKCRQQMKGKQQWVASISDFTAGTSWKYP
jgi:secreted Zn-dependent insulinase-like peptidase